MLSYDICLCTKARVISSQGLPFQAPTSNIPFTSLSLDVVDAAHGALCDPSSDEALSPDVLILSTSCQRLTHINAISAWKDTEATEEYAVLASSHGEVGKLMVAPANPNPGPYEALVGIVLRFSRRRGSPTCHGRRPVAKRAPLLFWRQSRRRICTYPTLTPTPTPAPASAAAPAPVVILL